MLVEDGMEDMAPLPLPFDDLYFPFDELLGDDSDFREGRGCNNDSMSAQVSVNS